VTESCGAEEVVGAEIFAAMRGDSDGAGAGCGGGEVADELRRDSLPPVGSCDADLYERCEERLGVGAVPEDGERDYAVGDCCDAYFFAPLVLDEGLVREES
jgi:hypothetical protein